MTHEELRQSFYHALTNDYRQGELQSLYHWCAQEISGMSRGQAYLNAKEEVSVNEQAEWMTCIKRLKEQEPVQYIFNKAEFMSMELFVDENVLIPRPETEELVQLVLESESSIDHKLLDVGTGSGCIALAIKAARPYWEVAGMDVSEGALAVARQNGATEKLPINWIESDIKNGLPDKFEADIIVSNPPYIPSELESSLERNVVEYEPGLALFTPKDDPFYFFKQIASAARLAKVKAIYFETHATDLVRLRNELSGLWLGEMEVVPDIAGKPRFLVLRKE